MRTFNWLLWLNAAYLVFIVAITVLNWMGPDRFWIGALNFYLPQLIWALPGVLLALAACRSSRLLALVPLLGVLWVVGPIMDWHWSTNKAWADTSRQTLRVMTWNVKYGKRDLMPLIEELERSQPDLVLFQDAVDSGAGPLADYLAGWQIHNLGQYLVASRFPISEVEVYELPYHERRGESFLRCKVRVGSRDVTIYNVHFKTPRRGLNAFRKARRGAWYIPRAIDRFEENVDTRLRQARKVSEFLAREKGDVVVAGDFNSPDHSLVCETLRNSGLADAFALGGRGYGYTYGHFLLKNKVPWLRSSWMRIDHIMTTPGIRVQRCWVGTRRASDHRPVIADFVVNNSR